MQLQEMFSKQLSIVVLAVLTTLVSCGLKQELDKKEGSSNINSKSSETQSWLKPWQNSKIKDNNIFSTLIVKPIKSSKNLLKNLPSNDNFD